MKNRGGLWITASCYAILWLNFMVLGGVLLFIFVWRVSSWIFTFQIIILVISTMI